MFDVYMEVIEGQNHAAVVSHKTGKMEDIFLDYPRGYAFHTPKWAAIYYGKVTQVDTRLNAAFVDLGNGKQGILPAKHFWKPVGTKGSGPPKHRDISYLVGTGEWLFVQVKAEGHDTDEEVHRKLARLTTKIRIPGRSLLYSPNIVGIFSSHWISDREESFIGEKLRKRHPRGGWVIRQMAPQLSDDVLYCEADHLVDEWEAAKEAAREARDAQKPARVWDAPDAIERVFIDYARRGIDRIEVMTRQQAAHARLWTERFAPDLTDKIFVAAFSPQDRVKSLFEAHGIHSAMELLNERTVYLPSGGNIVIERTQACVVIDINAGPSDSYTANMEAAEEIMRQIRIRNHSGIIICDMISSDKGTRNQLVTAFEENGRFDPADPQVHGLTRLMMMEMTRRRRSASLRDKTSLIADKFPGNK
ncbi:MAG: hypothetical protein EA357_05775 [Micavibrio sp.]|nr:MAG: hypothetical protein EA357_05775 [Micavibrio sp.]